jgi:signal transduction histidine kinase
MKRLRSLPLQLFVLIVLPLTALLLLIAFGSLYLHQEAMRTLVGERDERAARAAATAITEQLNHRQSAIYSLALHAMNASDPAHALADVAFLFPDFEGGMALYSADNTFLSATNHNEIWGTQTFVEHLDSLPQENDAHDIWFLPVFSDALSAEVLLPVAATTDHFIAVGAFSPANLARRALSDIFATSEQATAYVVATNGAIVYQTGTPPWSDLPPQQHPGVADALRGESGATYLDVDGSEYVIAFSPIPSAGWALVIAEPWRAVADPQLRATELGPLLIVPVMLITLIVLWFGLRQIVQPLQLLERQATMLSRGDFAAIEEPVGGISEIQRLQSELVRMARKVKLAQQSLRGYLGAITTAQEEERRRLARDLHDDTIQSLIALNQQVQLAQLSTQNEATLHKLSYMKQMVEQTISDLRRVTRDLRPIYLEDLGLVTALDMLARDTERLSNISVTLQVSGERRRLQSDIELALYRIAQEALSNIVRHAKATNVTIHLEFGDPQVRLAVKDNGNGFVVPKDPAEMAASGHFGLLGIQERAELMGARMELASASNEGTKLSILLPEA